MLSSVQVRVYTGGGGAALVVGSEEAVGVVSDALVVTVDFPRVLPSPDPVCFFSIAGRQETA